MITVHKYVLELADYFDLKLPEGAKVLSVQHQNGAICLWVLVNTDSPLKTTHFGFVGTGHEQHPGLRFAPFIETLQMGNFVFHLFGGKQERF